MDEERREEREGEKQRRRKRMWERDNRREVLRERKISIAREGSSRERKERGKREE